MEKLVDANYLIDKYASDKEKAKHLGLHVGLVFKECEIVISKQYQVTAIDMLTGRKVTSRLFKRALEK